MSVVLNVEEIGPCRKELKIEIPANRYDMLCFEGIALNLKVFLEKEKLPKWQVTPPKDGQLQELHIKPEVGCV